jgi:hypothetical protein
MSEKIKIFRIQHPKLGSGAYGSGVDWLWTEQGYPGGDNHPGPNDDDGISGFWSDLSWPAKESYFFGFASMEQYEKWFFMQDWREAMHNAGLKMFIFEVDAKYAVIGKSQAIFQRKFAEVLDIQDLICQTEASQLEHV